MNITSNPMLNGLLYPTLQALDEEYLGMDIESGGIDQRKIFCHARNIMPKLGYKKRSYFMTQMVPRLRQTESNTQNNSQISNKMSASNINTKIDLLDGKKQIINKCYCLPGNIEDNCLMDILEFVIFPILVQNGKQFIINRKEHNMVVQLYMIRLNKLKMISQQK